MFENNFDSNYDIDNIDLQEEMYERDIIEEEAENEEQLEEMLEEEAEETAISLCRALTARNLNNDLDIKNEKDRTVYTFKYRGDVYTGFVIFKLDKNTYIFSVEDKDSSNGRKSKKFNLSEIKQIN